jgi:hypothetical protein
VDVNNKLSEICLLLVLAAKLLASFTTLSVLVTRHGKKDRKWNVFVLLYRARVLRSRFGSFYSILFLFFFFIPIRRVQQPEPCGISAGEKSERGTASGTEMFRRPAGG